MNHACVYANNDGFSRSVVLLGFVVGLVSADVASACHLGAVSCFDGIACDLVSTNASISGAGHLSEHVSDNQSCKSQEVPHCVFHEGSLEGLP